MNHFSVGVDRGSSDRTSQRTRRRSASSWSRSCLALLVLSLSWAWSAESPLFGAITSLDRGAFDAALAAGADVNATDAMGQTPLMYAITQRQVGLSAALLDAGADVRATTDAGWTVLHYAARHMAPRDLVTMLLEASGDPRVADGDGQTAEDVAEAVGNQMYVETLRAFEGSVSARLVNAIVALDGVAFAAALEHGADVNKVDTFGQTPLMYAVSANQLGMTQRLLAGGARVDAASSAGWTALHYAARSGISDRIATALLEAGANLYRTNQDGDTAQAVARSEGNEAFLTVYARFDASARARAEAARVAAASTQQASPPTGDRAPATQGAVRATADACTLPVIRSSTQAVIIEGGSQGADAFWRSTLTSAFGTTVSPSGGNTYTGIDSFRKAVFIASVPIPHGCSGGRSVVDVGEVRVCSVRFDATTMSGMSPSQLTLTTGGSSTRVRVELPWSASGGLSRPSLCDVSVLRW